MQLQQPTPGQARSVVVEPVIPSVAGEFYSWSAEFNSERPLGYLFKSPAPTSRPVAEAECIDLPIDLVFFFEDAIVRLCTPESVPAARLVRNYVAFDDLKHTAIASVDITQDQFAWVCANKAAATLVEICGLAVSNDEAVVPVSPSLIFAVQTEAGICGLILIKEVTSGSVKIEACHYLPT